MPFRIGSSYSKGERKLAEEKKATLVTAELVQGKMLFGHECGIKTRYLI